MYETHQETIDMLSDKLAEAHAEIALLRQGVLPNAVPVKPCNMCQHYYEKFSDICERCCHNHPNQYLLKEKTQQDDS